MYIETYKTISDAFEQLKISGDPNKNINCDFSGIKSLIMGYSNYYEVVNNWMSVHYLGAGSYTPYGGPCGNQYWYKQKPFYVSMLNKNVFPLLIINYDNSVTIAGYYKVDSIYKRIGDQGFAYFHIKLLRTTYQSPQKEPQVQQANLKI